jgi:hypothetical protein
MFEYTQNRFVQSKRIICANIYTKNNEIRVAIDIDTEKTGETVVYTSTFASMEQARAFIQTIPTN